MRSTFGMMQHFIPATIALTIGAFSAASASASADIAVSSITASATTVQPGGQVGIGFTVANVGSTAASNGHVEISLSNSHAYINTMLAPIDTTLDSNATHGSCAMGTVNPAAQYTWQLLVSMPQSGSCAIVVNVSCDSDSDTNNNVSTKNITVSGSGGGGGGPLSADLSLAWDTADNKGPVVAPKNGSEKLTATATISNIGNAATTGTCTINYYLTNTASFSPLLVAPIKIHTYSVVKPGKPKHYGIKTSLFSPDTFSGKYLTAIVTYPYDYYASNDSVQYHFP